MVVNVRDRNGIRYGDFEIHGIKERFPVQAITSTNLNHAKIMEESDFNFRTNFLEIIDVNPEQIVTDPDYRMRSISRISNIIQQNPDRLCLFVPNRARTMKINKNVNLVLIQFQIECGFKIIKAFFKHTRHALQNLYEYRSLIPQGRSLMIVIDEGLSPIVFQQLYLNAYNNGDEIVGFLGREPSKNNNNIRLNLGFIKTRNKDKIIRLVSFTNKKFGNIVSSLVFHLFGFDVYSFWTRRGNPNKPLTELSVLNGFSFQPLTNASNFVCVITGISLYESARRLAVDEKSSVPISIYNIRKLNELFEVLQDRFTRPELELIAGDLVF